MKEITKQYTNGEVTIVWKPATCVHSRICFTGLSGVFHPQKMPWITPEDSSTDKIIAQVKKCPSGALSYYLNSEGPTVEKAEAETIVEPAPNGPLMVHGNISVKDSSGNATRKGTVTAFCRCGGSSNKPYCDGTHRKIGFQA